MVQVWFNCESVVIVHSLLETPLFYLHPMFSYSGQSSISSMWIRTVVFLCCRVFVFLVLCMCRPPRFLSSPPSCLSSLQTSFGRSWFRLQCQNQLVFPLIFFFFRWRGVLFAHGHCCMIHMDPPHLQTQLECRLNVLLLYLLPLHPSCTPPSLTCTHSTHYMWHACLVLTQLPLIDWGHHFVHFFVCPLSVLPFVISFPLTVLLLFLSGSYQSCSLSPFTFLSFSDVTSVFHFISGSFCSLINKQMTSSLW